jgi:hypothetical protein
VLWALSNESPLTTAQRNRLREILALRTKDAGMLREAVDLLRDCGAVSWKNSDFKCVLVLFHGDS